MMTKTYFTIIVTAQLLLGGCKRDKAETAANADSTPRAPASTAPAAPFTETQAVNIMLAIDQARLTNAQAVRAKSENESVLEYTRVIVTDHRAMTVLLDSLLKSAGATPGMDVVSQQFLSAAEQFAMEIAQRDSGINNAYLVREISDHERALQMLEGGVIPSARSAQIKTLLEQLVPAYHAHLQRARDILAARRAAALARPATPPAPQPPPTTTTTTTNIITTTTTNM